MIGALDTRAISQSVAAAALDPMRWFRPTRVQLAMLSDDRLRTQMRGPNQAGKTEALAADVLDIMLGLGLWQPSRPNRHPPPVEIWVVCASWQQSLIVQRKVHGLLPKGQLNPKSGFNRKNGFTGAAFELANGSLCTFKTVGQDFTDLASATLDGVFVDEPPPEDAWAEFAQRVSKKRGFIRLYYTPVHKPTAWLEAKVEAGELHEHVFGLRLDECWPVGVNGPALVPFVSRDTILQKLLDIPAHLRAQMLEGAWRGLPLGAYFPSFNEALHVAWPSDMEEHVWQIGVGFDFGTAPGKMSAALVYVRGGHTSDPEIVFADAIAAGPDETWDGVELAGRTRAMVERHGLDYHSISLWVGDRSAQGTKSGARMDVQLMRGHLREAFGIQPHESRAVHKARKGANSVLSQCSFIDSRFRRRRAWVSPVCPAALREFFVSFDGDPRDNRKDIGDAARYAAIAMIKVHLAYRYSAAA